MDNTEFPRFKMYDRVWVVYSDSMTESLMVNGIDFVNKTYTLRDTDILWDTHHYKQENLAGSFYEACKMVVDRGVPNETI